MIFRHDSKSQYHTSKLHLIRRRQFLYDDIFISRILFKTTQPAHLITVLSITMIAFFVFPAEIEDNKPSRLTNFVYLAAFATHLGAQIWMTFVSGLSLYFALPRHSFGCVQKVLFPKYFLLNSFLSLVTLLIFLDHHNSHLHEMDILIQVSSDFFLKHTIWRRYRQCSTVLLKRCFLCCRRFWCSFAFLASSS